jgi:hypothetical protein
LDATKAASHRTLGSIPEDFIYFNADTFTNRKRMVGPTAPDQHEERRNRQEVQRARSSIDRKFKEPLVQRVRIANHV